MLLINKKNFGVQIKKQEAGIMTLNSKPSSRCSAYIAQKIPEDSVCELTKQVTEFRCPNNAS